MFKPFAEETGIKVIDTSTPNVAKIKAQVDTGNVEWDCVYTSLNYFYNLGPQYFEPHRLFSMAKKSRSMLFQRNR